MTNTLLAILIGLCQIGFGMHFLDTVKKEFDAKNKPFTFMTRLHVFFFWWGAFVPKILGNKVIWD